MSRLYPCVYCTEDGYCKKFSDEEVVSWCVQSPCKDEKPSNADRIRSMSDEELANQLAGEQYVVIRTFLLGFDKELLEDLDEEIKMAWPEAVKEKLNWLKQEATDVN